VWGAATFTVASLGDAPGRIRFPPGTWKLVLATDRAIAADPAAAGTVLIPAWTAAIYQLVAARD